MFKNTHNITADIVSLICLLFCMFSCFVLLKLRALGYGTIMIFMICFISLLRIERGSITCIKSAVTLQRMASVYVSVCSYARIRSQTLTHTLGVRQAYVVYVPNTLTYVGVRFWTCSKLISVCERIEYTLLIRQPYARHTLDTLDIR